MKFLNWPLLAAALIAGHLGAARADTVYLKNGSKFEGKITVEGDEVIVRLENGSRLPFPKDRVVRIERGPAPWEQYAEKAAAVKPGDAAGHLELAKWCRAKNLLKRARKHIDEVLKAEPDNAEAHGMLGHEKVGGKWMSREDALKAKGYVQVDGKWLSPEEYAKYQAANRGKEAAEKELARLKQLGDSDPAKVAAARKFYTDRGARSLQNLMWALTNVRDSKAQTEAAKLINQIGPNQKVHSLWLAQAAIKTSSNNCTKEICRGIKARDDTAAMTYLVLWAAAENPNRRKAAWCLSLINDKRAYKALIGCVAQQPKNTLPGMGGMNLSTLGSMTGSGGTMTGGTGIKAGEVVPAADSLEYISGKVYRNDVKKWLKWLDSLDRAPGGAVIAPQK
ncbi:MAG: tetratricopeptide repeat protein [Planctomycetota bacterium]|jgi:hypothetical protein